MSKIIIGIAALSLALAADPVSSPGGAQGTSTGPAGTQGRPAPSPPTTSKPAKPGAVARGKARKPPVAARVDVNSATREELTRLGINGAVATKIIAGRPYRNKAELKSRRLMTPAEYLRITSKITVSRSK